MHYSKCHVNAALRCAKQTLQTVLHLTVFTLMTYSTCYH